MSITAAPDWNGAYVIADLHRGSAAAPGHGRVHAIGLGWIGLDPAPRRAGSRGDFAPYTSTHYRESQHQITGKPIHLVLDAVDEGIMGLTISDA